jgi:NitT/TauT family transport system ATP-binding protein
MNATIPSTGSPRDPGTADKVALEGVSLRFGSRDQGHLAVRDVELRLADGEFLSIVGPSGCGKSTLLKMVAGLLRPSSGRVLLDGQPVDGVPTHVGLVFQNDALLPWRTVADNVRFPLSLKGGGKREQQARVDELLGMVGLSEFADFFPRQLSGGMRKRVALARTLAHDPEVLLMDEPFGPLDAQTRIRLGGEFLDLWESVGKSVMFVTHDVEEAIALSDRVVVMSAAPGHIKADFRIDLPRPRDFYEIRFDERFKELHREIWHELAAEHGTNE